MNATTSRPIVQELATGLRFPEGPVAMPDGSVVLVEIERRTLSRVTPDGRIEVVAHLGGGPNGAAMGPAGKIYVTNNGGLKFVDRPGKLFPVAQADDYVTGSIQIVDPDTGKFETLYDRCDGRRLCGPNDLVFDDAGGFWFTDHGSTTHHHRTHGALYYAKANGSKIMRVLRELISPNGVGLSPDGNTVYYAETFTARLWSLPLSRPGKPAKVEGFTPGVFVNNFPGIAYFDSLGVQADGGVCVATILAGGVTTFWPGTKRMKHTPIPDPLVTNICWGGKNMRMAYITASGTGKLIAMEWPKPGLRLNYNA